MKRIFTSLLCLFALVCATDKSAAQNLTFNSFDSNPFPDGTPSTGWTNVNVTGSPALWQSATSATGTDPANPGPHSGTGFAYFHWNNDFAASADLISPAMDFSAAGTYRVSFWLYRDASNLFGTDDEMYVYINTAPTGTGGTEVAHMYRYMGQPPVVSTVGWYQYSFDLPPSFNGPNTYVIFRGITYQGYDIMLDDVSVDLFTPCTGTPATPDVVGVSAICPNNSFTLSTTVNATAGSMYHIFQTSSSPAGPWTTVQTSTSTSYASTGITATTYYQVIDSCDASLQTSTSAVFTVSLNPGNLCYCVPTTDDGCDLDYVTEITLATIDNTTGCVENGSGPFTGTLYTTPNPTLNTGSSYPLMVSTFGDFGGDDVFVWIDFNADGTFDASELVLDGVGSGGDNNTFNTTVNVPPGAVTGQTLMRVRTSYTPDGTIPDPCSDYVFGEVQDYYVTIASSTPVAPTITLNNSPVCENGTITLTANSTSGGTYSWSGPNSFSSSGPSITLPATLAAAGTYSVFVTVGVFTSPITTTNVVVNPAAVAAVTPTGTFDICAGSSVALNATQTAGNTYQWYNSGGLISGETNPSYTATAPETYSVTVTTAALCAATSPNTVVTQSPAPTITPSGPTSICTGGSVILIANNGPGYTFQWQLDGSDIPGETNTFYTATSNSNITVVVNYGTGCIDTSLPQPVVVVPTPVATVAPTGPFVFCDGGSITLDGTTTGATFYQWLKDGQNILLANSATYTATLTGSYQVIAINSIGCSDTSNISVSVTANPLPNAVISGPASVCSGSSGTVTITGTPLSIISFTVDGAAVPDVTLDNLGTATISTLVLTTPTTITLTNAVDGITGCSQAIIGQSLTINIDPLPTVALTGTATLCAGDNTNITFTGTPGAIVAYTVNGVAAVPDLTIDPSGISVVNTGALAATAAYLVTNVTDGTTGCSQVIPTSVTITVNQLPTASFNSAASIVCNGDSTLLYFAGTPGAVVSYTANTVAAVDAVLNAAGFDTVNTGALTTPTTYALTQVQLGGIPACPVTLSATLDVAINPLPTAAVAGATTICNGDSTVITFSGTAGAIVDFSINSVTTGQVTLDAGGLAPYNTHALFADAFYDITTVTDGTTGCFQPGTGQNVLITVTPLPTVTISSSVVICNGDNTTITLNGVPGAMVSYNVDGIPALDIQLDPLTGNATINDGALVDTTYYTFTNISDPATGCSQPLNVTDTIMVNPLPTATVSAAAATLCSGDNTVLTFTGTPNTSVTYTVNSNPVPDIALDATGTATINTGALAGPSVSIDLVSVSFNNGGPLCTQLVSGNATITVNPLPTIINITPATATLCHGDSLDMTANGTPNATFTYTQNGVAFPGQQLDASFGTVTFNSHGLLTNTTVAITSVTDPTTGCAQAVSGQTVVIAVNPLPFVSITAGGPATFCNGNSVNLTCNNTSGTYQWYRDGVAQGGATNQSFIATQSGIYNVDFTSGCHDSAATGVTVIVNPLPTATVTPGGPSSFCQGSSLTLMATVTTGFSYQWHNGVTTPVGATDANYTVFAAGTYYATITDSNGCSSSSNSNTVTINPTPVVTVTWVGGPSATTFCQGGLLVLSSSPVPSTGNHAWFRDGVALGLFTNAITANASGVYVDSFTTSSGCSALSNPVAITVNPAPPTAVTTIGTTSICPGGSAIFVANNVTPSYTFQWNINGAAIPGATDSVYIADSAASYTVQISNGFPCSALSTAINVTVNTPVATISASGPATFCDGGFVNFNANIGSSFQWFLDGNAIPGEVNTSYLAMTSGNYQVEVTNANGCPALSLPTVVTVNPTPDATITPTGPLVLCQGDTAGLSIPADATAAYQWYNGAGAIAGATNSAYGAATADAFFVLATNGFGCTAASPAVSIAVNPIPVSVILPPTATVLCSGSVTTLQSQTAVLTDTYQWQINGTDIPGATDPAYDASTSGMYTLVVTNASGCPITSAGMQINVLSFPTVMTNDPTTFCYGGSATLTVDAASIVPGLAYQWQRNGTSISGATNPIYVVTDGGLYTVIVSIPTVCSVFSSYLIMTVNPLPVPGIVNNGGTLSTEAYVSYQWYENNQPIPGAQSQSLVPASNGIYYVAATDSQGCTGVSNALDLIDLDVNNINSIRDAVKIYPNPATAMVHIESPIKVNATITAIDGKVVIRKDEAKDIDISALADGVYVITLSDVNGQQIKMEKLVKAGN